MTNSIQVSTRYEPLNLPDAEIFYLPNREWGEHDSRILQRLIGGTPWRSERITLWGRSYVQPRLVAWYGDAEARYSYSGLRLEPLPWTDLLSDLKRRVESLSNAQFNSVMLNYYRDHTDSMGAHSDDEAELGPFPIIGSLSFGATRTLTFKHRQRRELKSVRIPLTSGSLLLMAGATQHHWKHAIGKQTRPCGPRINLTFRKIIAAPSSHPGR